MGLHKPDRQLILRCVCGNPADDKDVAEVVTSLEKRAVNLGLISGSTFKTLVISLQQPAQTAIIFRAFPLLFKEPYGHARIYVVGHGSWLSQTIGGFTAAQIASPINQGYPEYPKAGTVISVVGCQLARDHDAPAYGGLTANSVNSFASNLHALLKNKELVVFARAHRVTTYRTDADRGRKLVRPVADGPFVRQPPNSKVMFTWKDGKQVRQWWDYVTNTAGAEI